MPAGSRSPRHAGDSGNQDRIAARDRVSSVASDTDSERGREGEVIKNNYFIVFLLKILKSASIYSAFIALFLLLLYIMSSAFLKFISELETYPNSSSKIKNLIDHNGPGHYDLTKIFDKKITYICTSVTGRDPRQIAHELLQISEKFLLKHQKNYFIREDSISFIIIYNDGFNIESINSGDLYTGSQVKNSCIKNYGNLNFVLSSFKARNQPSISLESITSSQSEMQTSNGGSL